MSALYPNEGELRENSMGDRVFVTMMGCSWDLVEHMCVWCVCIYKEFLLGNKDRTESLGIGSRCSGSGEVNVSLRS